MSSSRVHGTRAVAFKPNLPVWLSETAALDAGLLLLVFALTFLFIRGLGLVSFDFVLLVENLKLPLTQSADELHRPLRNILLKGFGSLLGVRYVWPYRLLVAASYTAVLGLLFQLTRRVGAGRMGAWAAVLVMAFFPRNQEVLFWFAAWQDVLVGICLLLTCLLFLDYRETRRVARLAWAAAAYVVALGCKETTVVIPFLLLMLDIYRERSFAPLKKPAFWRAYFPFAGIMLLYVVYYLWDSGIASLAGGRTGGIYGFHGVIGVAAGVVRALINLALPFTLPAPLGFAQIRPYHVMLLFLEALVVTFLVWRTRAWPELLLATGWLICTILPTAAFAAAINADRYLFVPLTGAAVLAGLLVNALAASAPAWKRILIWTALAIYSLTGILRLATYREVRRRAADESAAVVAQTIQACSQLSAGSEVDLVNQTLFLHPYVVSVFAHGLSGALRGHGAPSNVRILGNFATGEPAQQTLVDRLRACGQLPLRNAGHRIVLMTIDHRIVQIGSECAGTVIDRDRAERPGSWSVVDSGG